MLQTPIFSLLSVIDYYTFISDLNAKERIKDSIVSLLQHDFDQILR